MVEDNSLSSFNDFEIDQLMKEAFDEIQIQPDERQRVAKAKNLFIPQNDASRLIFRFAKKTGTETLFE